MSRWLFDLGNTRLKLAALGADGGLGPVHAINHGSGIPVEAIDALLPDAGGAAYVASVAPSARTVELLRLLSARFSRVSVARSSAACGGVRSGYASPAQLGVDRFLALLGARHRAPGPWLLAGVGTALTVDLLDAEGRHRGGLIGPSPATMRAGLHQAAAHLPTAGGSPAGFADNTLDALASGCDWAALGLLQRSQRQARDLLGEAPGLLLHGGGAAALLPWLPQAAYVPELVLLGLAHWADMGRADGSG